MTWTAWLPGWDMITTRQLEIRKRRGLMITLILLVLLPVVLVYGLRLVFHVVDPHSYGPAGSAALFSQLSNLTAEFGFIGAAALGAAAGTTDLSDGMFRHLVITGRSRLALYLARIPAGLAITIPLVALAFIMNCLVTSYDSPSASSTVAMYGVTAPGGLSESGLETWLVDHPQQVAGALPILSVGPQASAARVRTAVEANIGTLYRAYTDDQIANSPPADNEMAKIGLWLELEVGIGFLVGLGLGALSGQRTTTTIVLIALELIVTPILAHTQIPYFIDGQRLVVGIAMDQLRPAALAAGTASGGGGGPGAALFGGHGALSIPPMPTWAMITVIVGWIVGWTGLGAWRMITRDA
jgi:hypothetical protein